MFLLRILSTCKYLQHARKYRRAVVIYIAYRFIRKTFGKKGHTTRKFRQNRVPPELFFRYGIHETAFLKEPREGQSICYGKFHNRRSLLTIRLSMLRYARVCFNILHNCCQQHIEYLSKAKVDD
ncbi:unnamed protein product [Acanthoscelides obtectus]|uniref:Uncharacterized protein n=1 Tax=Acanthoscelides obtectus TaxID=200917 RepID=A0A9P0KX25_ACAOB|nr:unnamed protein product [Acanthoscelides obtectus]CAK1676849.1 hypothetical protein AOBTE_LOCUS30969 [Acanthoscelides obtectus]